MENVIEQFIETGEKIKEEYQENKNKLATTKELIKRYKNL